MILLRSLSTNEVQWVWSLNGYPHDEFEQLATLPEGGFPGDYAWIDGALAAILSASLERRWALVKARRDAVLNGGCATPLGNMQTDERSRGFLSAAVNGAQVSLGGGGTMTFKWRMADNSVVEHSAQEIIAAGMAVLAHVSASYDVANGLESAILAATTAAEIEAVDIDGADWP